MLNDEHDQHLKTENVFEFFVFIEVKLNVGASSHVTRVHNTLRTEIESWKDVESLVDEIGR
jgi:hypothetical protein